MERNSGNTARMLKEATRSVHRTYMRNFDENLTQLALDVPLKDEFTDISIENFLQGRDAYEVFMDPILLLDTFCNIGIMDSEEIFQAMKKIQNMALAAVVCGTELTKTPTSSNYRYFVDTVER